MNREARPGETLAVVTFANVEGLDVLLEVIQRIRREKFPEAQAAQSEPASPQDMAVYQAIADGYPGMKAAQGAGEVVAPKLIGWRTENFLWETDDVEKARNWEPNIGVLPIFEGDPNTKLYTHPTPAQPAPVVLDVDALTDKIASMLHGTHHCLRVWEAWQIGTMSEDDFEPVGESDTPREIAEAILEMLAATPAPTAQAAQQGEK